MAALSTVSTASLTQPFLLLIPVCVGSQLAFMLPQATPPNAVVFATDRVPLSSFIKAGIALNVAGLILAPLMILGIGLTTEEECASAWLRAAVPWAGAVRC